VEKVPKIATVKLKGLPSSWEEKKIIFDEEKKKFYLNIGSTTLTKETDHISRGKNWEDIGRQIAAFKKRV